MPVREGMVGVRGGDTGAGAAAAKFPAPPRPERERAPVVVVVLEAVVLLSCWGRFCASGSWV